MSAAGTGGGEHRGVVVSGKVEDGAILGDNDINEMKVAGHAPELVQAASRDDDDRDASCARVGNGIASGRVQPVVLSSRSVVVQRNDPEFHSHLRSCHLSRRNDTVTVRMNFSARPFRITGEYRPAAPLRALPSRILPAIATPVGFDPAFLVDDRLENHDTLELLHYRQQRVHRFHAVYERRLLDLTSGA